MKQFKQIDFGLQVALYVGFFIASLIKRDNIFAGYFCIGAWQLLSMLIHLVKSWFWHTQTRAIYSKISFLTVLLMLSSFVIPVFFVIYGILFFLAPFLALIYMWICYDEIRHKMKRPLAILK
jgi:hypothetical protein